MHSEIVDGKLVITIDLETNGSRRIAQSGANYVDYSTGRAFVKAAGGKKVNLTVIEAIDESKIDPAVAEARRMAKELVEQAKKQARELVAAACA